MLENELRGMIQKAVEKLDGHISWIESHATSAGFPDADICIDGAIIQAELKVEKSNGDIEIRPTQYRWFKDRVDAGGLPVLIVGTDNGFWLVPGHMVNCAPEHKGSTRLHSMEQIHNGRFCSHRPTADDMIKLCTEWCDRS